MAKFLVTGTAEIGFEMIVDADTEDEAREEAEMNLEFSHNLRSVDYDQVQVLDA